MTAFFQLGAHLPLWLLRRLGSLLGHAIWWLSPAYRRMFRANWALAMAGDQASPSQRARQHRAIGQAGQMVLELPKIWCDDQAWQAMALVGLEALTAAQARGRGVIVLTPHLGAFELAPRVLGRHHPMTVLYRPARQPAVERLLQRLRPTAQVATAPANAAGVRQLLRALRSGQVIGMLPDQVPSKGDGLWAPFFGRPAYTMVLPLRLAQTTGASLIWALALRVPGGWQLSLEDWRPEGLDQPDTPLQTLVEALNRKTEEVILRAPDQYLWAYNRYKNPQAGGAPTA